MAEDFIKDTEQAWEYLEPGKDGHYPEGAWFYRDTVATPSGIRNIAPYRRGRGAARPAHNKNKGAFIAEFYEKGYINKYFDTLEEAKTYVEQQVLSYKLTKTKKA